MTDRAKETITVEKGRGKFYVRVNYKDINTGKVRRRKVDEAPTREEALEVSKKYKKFIEDGGSLSEQLDNKKITLGDCIEMALEKEYNRRNKKTGNTYLSYKQTYNTHIKGKLGDVYIQRLRTSMIQDFLDKKAKDYAYSTVSSMKAVIKKGVKYALQNDIIHIDVTVGLEVSGKDPSSSSRTNVLSKQELKEILDDTKGTELGLQILLASSHGLRVSEVMGLTWNNIDMENRIIIVNQIIAKNRKGDYVIQKFTKNKEDIVVHISDMLYEALKEYKVEWNKKVLQFGSRKQDQLLFTDREMNPIRPGYTTAKFKRYMKSKGYEGITFHGLRHTFATILYDKGCSLEMIGQLLNHKDPSLAVRTYVHLTDRKRAEITDALAEDLSM